MFQLSQDLSCCQQYIDLSKTRKNYQKLQRIAVEPRQTFLSQKSVIIYISPTLIESNQDEMDIFPVTIQYL